MSAKRYHSLELHNMIAVAYRLKMNTVCEHIMFCLYADNKVQQMSVETTPMRMREQLLRTRAQLGVYYVIISYNAEQSK